MDSDGDGVKDDRDMCPDSASAAAVDAQGCTPSQRDSDNDGVTDDLDQCPSTPSGRAVDQRGCPLPTPVCGNGTVEAGESCDPPNGVTCDSSCHVIAGGAPANDACANATAVSAGNRSFSNRGANTDGPAEVAPCDMLGADIWFCYTAGCDGKATVNLCNSNFDTKMAIYAGCACPTTAPVLCDDDGCGQEGRGSKAEFTVTSGQSYLIRIGGWSSDQGSGTMAITCTPSGGGGGVCQGNSDCDDSVYCNGAETCSGGSCVQGTAVDCSDAVSCTADSCNETTDACDHVPNNAACSDGLFCNGPETCDASEGCKPGAAPCASGMICDEDQDACVAACTSDGDCSDDLFCNGVEKCVDNRCQAGTAVDCGDGVECTDDFCNEVTDACTNTADDANCNDGLFCNGTETCDAVADCLAGTSPCGDGVDCTDDVCNEATDRCAYTPNNANCDDGLFCNGEEVCHATLGCQPGTAPPCDDWVDCTDDFCDEPGKSCVNTPNNANCDDGLYCNGAETCAEGGCQPGVPVVCNDGVQCTVDSCNETTDACGSVPSDTRCDDGVFCNGAETCDPVQGCLAGSNPCAFGTECDEGGDRCIECHEAAECDDRIACTFDDCDDGTCVHTPDDTACDDEQFCNGSETCDATAGCLAGSNPCYDGVDCTDDGCNEETDTCVYTPNHGMCPDNGVFCDGPEMCIPPEGCQSSGNPCVLAEVCHEDGDMCEPLPATWTSTQMMLMDAAGYGAPESYDLDSAGILELANYNLTKPALERAFGGIATVLATAVPPAQETSMYEVEIDLGEGYFETITQTIKIDEFTLSAAVEGNVVVATWTFDYTDVVLDDIPPLFGEDVETTRYFVGTQTGEVSVDGTQITWTGVEGTFQRCLSTTGCADPIPLQDLVGTEWVLGTWTR